MSAQMAQHFARILSYLELDGSSSINPIGTVAFNSADCTLRFHDGCTRGGNLQLQMFPRCGDKDTVAEFTLTAFPSMQAMLLPLGILAPIATMQQLSAVSIKLTGDFSKVVGSTLTEPVVVEFGVPTVPVVVDLGGGDTALANIETAINANTAKYAVKARLMPDADTGRVGIQGPDVGTWKLEITDHTGAVTAVQRKESKKKEV